jgi:hypothetical protein
MERDDCGARYEELKNNGVAQPVRAVFRDDSGNWFSLTDVGPARTAERLRCEQRPLGR